MHTRVAVLVAVVLAVLAVLAVLGAIGLTGMPVAAADTLSNGLTVTCNPADAVLSCVIGGCPRVGEDHNYNPDVVHARLPNGYQDELSISCINGIDPAVETVPLSSVGPGFTFGVQACRKVAIGSDKCGPWSNYTWTPPPPQAPPPTTNAAGHSCTQWTAHGEVLITGSNGMQTRISDWSGSGPAGGSTDAQLLNPKVVPMKVQDGFASGGLQGNRFDLVIAWLTPDGRPSDLTSHYTGTVDPGGTATGKMADTNGGNPGYSDAFTIRGYFSCAQ